MKRPLLVIGGLAAVGVAAYFLGGSASDRKTVTTTGAPSPAPAATSKDLVFRWAPNTTYDYSLHYASKTKALPVVGDNAVGTQIDGGLELEGTLSIHAYSDDGDAATLSYALSDCKGSFTVSGQPAWPDCRSVFDGKELLVKVDHFGKVRSVHAPAGGATLFEYTMRALIEETQVRLGGVAGIQSWVEAELLPQGTVESVYRIEDGRLVRTRASYNSLRAAGMLNGAPVAQSESAKHVIELDGTVVGKIHGTETLKATSNQHPFLDSKADLDLEKTGEREDDRGAIDLTKFTSRTLEDMPESTSMRQRMLEQRADGLSWESVIEALGEYGEAGKMPDHSKWTWRATALLELDPKRAYDLIPLFEGGRPGGKLRPLLLDLLASVSTPEAQKVMRQLIGSETAKHDPRSAQLVQRLGFMDNPDRETVKFINDRYASAKTAKNKNDRLASAFTLGTVSGKADDRDRKDAVETLTKDLEQAPADETVFYLRALANTDSPLALGTYRTNSSANDPEVRAAVADALDEPQLPESLELLMTLLQDQDAEVQRTALKSLRRYKLDGKVVFRLAEIANDGKILPANVRHVLDLVKTYRFVWKAEEEALLRALLAHEIDDVLVRAAAQQLLDATRLEAK